MALKRLAVVLVALTCMAVLIVPQPPATALGEPAFSVTPEQAVRVGGKIVVHAGYPETSLCYGWMTGPVRTAKVRGVNYLDINSRITLRAPSTPGLYYVNANCGKNTVRQRIAVVPRGASTKASCTVLESGFTSSERGEVTIGFVLRNSSPYLAATELKVAATWRDSSGAVIANRSIEVPDSLPKGTTGVMGETDVDVDASRVASVSVAATCESTTEPVGRVLSSSAVIAKLPGYQGLLVTGQFLNSTRASSESAHVYWIARNAAGAIVGGGTGYQPGFALPGGIATWERNMFTYGDQTAMLPLAGQASVYTD